MPAGDLSEYSFGGGGDSPCEKDGFLPHKKEEIMDDCTSCHPECLQISGLSDGKGISETSQGSHSVLYDESGILGETVEPEKLT